MWTIFKILLGIGILGILIAFPPLFILASAFAIGVWMDKLIEN